jgi:hypothetical protein
MLRTGVPSDDIVSFPNFLHLLLNSYSGVPHGKIAMTTIKPYPTKKDSEESLLSYKGDVGIGRS